ncbi:phosphotransferase [Mesorhizobium cantuariense]|uniref:Phosphotransferase n=1 Tax=Mesorhizobium cantuariense TaxID=1300275 RepID=A0ABV7MYZ4_9HYPH
MNARLLDVDDAVPYLLGCGLIDSDAIVEGDLTITSTIRRNRNLRVDGPPGRRYLVKQADGAKAGDQQTLRHEASFYSFCHRSLARTPMAKLLPRLVHTDEELALLVLELFSGAMPLWQHYLAQAELPRPVARELGRALGLLHATFRAPAMAGAEPLSQLPREPPGMLRVHQPSVEWLAVISAAGFQMLRIIQSRRRFSQQLDGLARLWQDDTVIHGDVRADNVLVLSPSGDEPVMLRLVDWELVQHGDAAWDLAAALQDLVALWVNTLQLPTTAPVLDLERANAQARYPWSMVQAMLRSLWLGYRGTAGLDADSANALLLRAVQFSSVRLIQAALESTQQAPALTSQAVLLLQIAANILDDPASAQARFYGIPLGLDT